MLGSLHSLRFLAFDKSTRYGQTEPPTIPVDELFEEGSFPEGEILEHPRDFNSFRVRETHEGSYERGALLGVAFFSSN